MYLDVSIWKRSIFFISICISHGFRGFVGPVCDLSKEIAMPPWSCCFQRSPPWRSSANSRMRWRRILLQLRSGEFCENLRRLNPNPMLGDVFFWVKLTQHDTTFYVQGGLILAMTSFGSCAAWSVFSGLLGFSKVHFCSEKMLRRIWGAVTRVQHGWDALVIRFTVTDTSGIDWWDKVVSWWRPSWIYVVSNFENMHWTEFSWNLSLRTSSLLFWCEDVKMVGKRQTQLLFFSFCWGLLSKTWMHRQESRDCQPLDKQWNNDFHGFSSLSFRETNAKCPPSNRNILPWWQVRTIEATYRAIQGGINVLQNKGQSLARDAGSLLKLYGRNTQISQTWHWGIDCGW